MKWRKGKLPSGVPAQFTITPSGVRVAVAQVPNRKGVSIFGRLANGLWEKIGKAEHAQQGMTRVANVATLSGAVS